MKMENGEFRKEIVAELAAFAKAFAFTVFFTVFAVLIGADRNTMVLSALTIQVFRWREAAR